MTKQLKAAEGLGELLAERDRLDVWLAALEGRRDTTPPQVYDRVHGDYSARRDALLALLSERSGELEAAVAKQAARLAIVEVEQRAKQEARAEAELRAAVGEYTPDKWTELSAASDAELGKLEARRTEVAREHAQAKELLASVKRSPGDAHAVVPDSAPSARTSAPASQVATPLRPAPPVAEPELLIMALGEMLVAPNAPLPKRPSAATTMPAEAAPAPSGARVRHEPDTSHRINTPSADELAFLRSMELGDPRNSSRAPAKDAQAPAPARSNPMPAETAPSRTSRPIAAPPAAAAAAAVPRPSRPVVAEPAAAVAMAAAERSPARMTDPDPRATNPTLPPDDAALLTEAAVNVPRASTDLHPSSGEARQTSPRLTSRDSANILKGVQAAHSKTLTCAACGTGNFATEWYCERCGAELSTL